MGCTTHQNLYAAYGGQVGTALQKCLMPLPHSSLAHARFTWSRGGGGCHSAAFDIGGALGVDIGSSVLDIGEGVL